MTFWWWHLLKCWCLGRCRQCRDQLNPWRKVYYYNIVTRSSYDRPFHTCYQCNKRNRHMANYGGNVQKWHSSNH